MTIGIAQLGTWHVHAAHHVQAARENEATDAVLVWDARPGAAETFGAKHGLPAATDLAAVLARDDVHAVVIDTATTEHVEVISAALRAGKHVFSEKVLATTTRDVDGLIALAAEKGRVLGVSLQRLIEAPVRTVKRLIDEGRLGTVTGSRMRYVHHGAVGTPWIPEHFFRLAETGGGALIDLGAHPFYLSMLVHGEAPSAVTAQIGHVTGREIEDNAAALLVYPGGVLGVAEMSMVGNHMGYSLEVTGTAGTAVIGPSDQRVMLRQGQSAEWEEQELSPALADPFDQWVEWVVSGSPDPAHLPLVRNVTRSIEAAYRSADAGTVVRLSSLG